MLKNVPNINIFSLFRPEMPAEQQTSSVLNELRVGRASLVSSAEVSDHYLSYLVYKHQSQDDEG